MFFVFVFVFSPDVFWELKISEKFWYQAQGKMGGKRNHHNLKRLKLPSCPFYRGTGWWTLAHVDTTNRGRDSNPKLFDDGWPPFHDRKDELPGASGRDFLLRVPGCFLRPGPAPHFLVFLSLTANLKVLAAFLSSGTSITAFLLVFFSQSQMHSGLQCIPFPASSLLLKTNTYTFCIQSNFMHVQQGSRVGVAEIRNL